MFYTCTYVCRNTVAASVRVLRMNVNFFFKTKTKSSPSHYRNKPYVAGAVTRVVVSKPEKRLHTHHRSIRISDEMSRDERDVIIMPSGIYNLRTNLMGFSFSCLQARRISELCICVCLYSRYPFSYDELMQRLPIVRKRFRRAYYKSPDCYPVKQSVVR